MTYGYDCRNNGSDNVFYNILDYTYHSWFLVSGRIFSNFMLALFANIGGLYCMRICIPLCIGVTYYLAIRLAMPKDYNSDKKCLVTFFVLSSFGLMPLRVVKFGIYWFAAACGYIIPVMNFLLLVYLYRKTGNIYTIIQSALIIVLCISSEQAIAMTLVWIISNMIYDKCLKRIISAKQIFFLIIALTASGLLICSPASQARMSSAGTNDVSFLNRIFSYVLRTITQFLSLGNIIQYAFLFLTILLVFFIKAQKRKC